MLSAANISHLGKTHLHHNPYPGKIEGEWFTDVDSIFKWIKAYDFPYNVEAGTFIWDCGSPHSKPLIFHLDKGNHLFRIRLNQDGTKIDKFVLTTDMPPSAPKNLMVTKTTATRVDLAWDENPEGDLAGYNIFRFNRTKEEGYKYGYPLSKYQFNNDNNLEARLEPCGLSIR